MNRKRFIYFSMIIIVAFILLAWLWFGTESDKTDNVGTAQISTTPTTTPISTPTASPTPNTNQLLSVPYINEAPSGNWSGPWKNACEEASIAMIEFFYDGKNIATIAESEQFMQKLFDVQDRLYGSNANANAEQFNEIINRHTSFTSRIVRNPTQQDIKTELDAGRPVISLHYGFDLNNKNIPFLRTGSSYHAMVIIGYDDKKEVFIVNDDGDSKYGAQHEYDYDLFMNTLHDYRHEVDKADGAPTVLFTEKKSE